MKKYILSSFIIIASFAFSQMAFAEEIIWTPQISLEEGESLSKLHYFNEINLFVVLGYDDEGNNFIMTSPNGIEWERNILPFSVSIQADISYGNGKFVIVSDNFSASSSDGTTWTENSSPGFWGHVTYGNGKFVASVWRNSPGGFNIMTSSDGENWESFIENFRLNPVYGNNIFVGRSLNQIRTSSDGEIWSEEIPLPLESGYLISNITFSHDLNLFLGVIGDDENNIFLITSPDGENWSSQPTGISTLNFYPYSIIHNNGLFSMWGEDKDANYVFATSSDGENWASFFSEYYFQNVIYKDSLFVAIGQDNDGRDHLMIGSFESENTSSNSSASSSILGTRFCKEGETTFCRIQPILDQHSNPFSLYIQLIELLEQLVTKLQSNSI